MISVDPFILAGGSSSRFGSPKVAMRIGGRSVVERIMEAIVRAFPDRTPALVVSTDQQHAVPFVLTTPVISDLYPGRGPLSGLHAALAYAGREWILAVACDYPFLTSELLLRIAKFAGDGFDAVVPIQQDGRMQPLCSFYRRKACLAVVEEFVTSTRPAPPLRAIFERVRTREVGFDELRDLPKSDRFFTNINTPGDCEAASEKL